MGRLENRCIVQRCVLASIACRWHAALSGRKPVPEATGSPVPTADSKVRVGVGVRFSPESKILKLPCSDRARLAVQLVEQRLGVFEVGGVEAFGEPVVDVGEHRARPDGRFPRRGKG